MKLPVFVHQVGTSYGESELPFDDSRSPFSEIYGKVADGLNFMSTYDLHGAAIGTIADVIEREQMHEADGGREWKPWMVPRGQQPGYGGVSYAEREGALMAEIAAAAAGDAETPVIILDVEPYSHGGSTPQFWRSDLGAGARTIRALLDTYVRLTAAAAMGKHVEVWLAIDAREPHMEAIDLEAWLAHPAVTRVMPQTYFNDFLARQASPDEAKEIISAANLLLTDDHGWPRGKISHILPASGALGVLQDAIQHCHATGTLRPSLWQRMTLSQENADAIAELTDPWGAQPVVGAGGVTAPEADALPDLPLELRGDQGARLDDVTRALAQLAEDTATVLTEQAAAIQKIRSMIIGN